MASHKTVYYTPGRQYRITADPGGTVFTVERQAASQLNLVARFYRLDLLTGWLAEHGISLDELTED
jgi:hypothetical protein